MTTLKEKLKIRQLTIGSWITLAHPAIAEIFARAGFDWLAVDLEILSIFVFEKVFAVSFLSISMPPVSLYLLSRRQQIWFRLSHGG